MKYAAVAVALAGVAVADKVVTGWEAYTTKAATSTWVDPATWEEDPSWKKKTTTAWEDPATWEEDPSWKKKKKTTTAWEDPATWEEDPSWKKKTTTTWADWEAVKATTVTGKCSYVTEVPVKKCKPGHPDKCWEYKSKTTVYADDCTWSDWVDPATKTSTWADWENVAVVTKTPVVVTKTNEWKDVVVVTTYVTPGWSKDGWFGPAWPVAKTDACQNNVVTSYGAPIWVPTPVAPAPVKPAPEKPVVGKGHAVIAPNGNKWSMTYTPYDAQSKCKTEEVIKIDIGKIASKGFTSVRVYSTQCETLKFIGDACRANGLKLILGVFIDKYGVSGAKTQVDAIAKWAQWDIVELIVIGNEALYQKFCTAEDLVWFIKESKKTFADAGYTGSCTTTEPLASWQSYGTKFCDVVDVVAANLYAYFNADTTCDKAGEFVQAEIEILAKICPGKEAYVMESGWPSAGQCNGKACPGKEEQKKAIKSIQDTCGAKIVFFSYENELWKEPGKYGVEQSWGCGELFESVASWKPLTVTSTTTAPAWTGWTTSTTKPADPATTWAAY